MVPLLESNRVNGHVVDRQQPQRGVDSIEHQLPNEARVYRAVPNAVGRGGFWDGLFLTVHSTQWETRQASA